MAVLGRDRQGNVDAEAAELDHRVLDRALGLVGNVKGRQAQSVDCCYGLGIERA